MPAGSRRKRRCNGLWRWARRLSLDSSVAAADLASRRRHRRCGGGSQSLGRCRQRRLPARLPLGLSERPTRDGAPALPNGPWLAAARAAGGGPPARSSPAHLGPGRDGMGLGAGATRTGRSAERPRLAAARPARPHAGRRRPRQRRSPHRAAGRGACGRRRSSRFPRARVASDELASLQSGSCSPANGARPRGCGSFSPADPTLIHARTLWNMDALYLPGTYGSEGSVATGIALLDTGATPYDGFGGPCWWGATELVLALLERGAPPQLAAQTGEWLAARLCGDALQRTGQLPPLAAHHQRLARCRCRSESRRPLRRHPLGIRPRGRAAGAASRRRRSRTAPPRAPKPPASAPRPRRRHAGTGSSRTPSCSTSTTSRVAARRR